MGWEPREEHIEYDRAGRVVRRTVVVREPEWNARERSLVLAHFANEADIGPFGIPLSRALTPTDAVFEAKPKPKRNMAVAAVQTASERYFDQYPDADPNDRSLMWSVREVPPEELAQQSDG